MGSPIFFQPETDLEAKIVAKAQELFLSIGFRNSTMDDLAKALGISKKTLYKTIPNKAALVHLCVTNHIKQEQKALLFLAENTTSAVEEIITIGVNIKNLLNQYNVFVIHDLIRLYPQSWQLLISYKKDFLVQLILKNIEKGVEQGVYQLPTDKNATARFFVFGTDLAFNTEAFPADVFTLAQIYKSFILYHLHAITTAKGKKEMQHYIEQLNF